MHWYILALRNFANFQGRARRKEYWTFVLVNLLILLVLTLISAMSSSSAGRDHALVDTVYPLFTLAVFISGVAVSIRRLHDSGRSGWWAIVPLVGLYFLCLAGDAGQNRYGADPKLVEV